MLALDLYLYVHIERVHVTKGCGFNTLAFERPVHCLALYTCLILVADGAGS